MSRTIFTGPTLHGEVRPNLAPPATIDAPSRPLTNDDLARAYDMGRDMERADTVAWLREHADAEHPIERGVPSLSPAGRGLLLLHADCIAEGKHRRSPSTSPSSEPTPEPEPVPSDLALGKRLVACRGWRWTAGMIRRDGYRVCWRKPPPAFHEDDGVPDLTDPATLGCLLALVREAWAADFIDVVCEQANDHEDGGYVWRVNLPWSKDTRGTTETEALVAALEAAP